jgi:hypothetical protein
MKELSTEAAYLFDHHERDIPTRMTTTANSIQFWTGMAPKIMNCFKSQSPIGAPQT